MPISVQLHIGLGHVSERRGTGAVFPVPDDESLFPYLRLVDPYDVTYFNSNQMGALLPELMRIEQTSTKSSEQESFST